MVKAPKQKTSYTAIVYIYVMTSFTQLMPWAFKLCLAKVTGHSLLYITVGLRVHG